MTREKDPYTKKWDTLVSITQVAVIEEKLEQQIAGIVHDPFFQVFNDVRKDCDSLDRGVCMEILRGYGLGPNLQRLLQQYWDG